MIFLSLVLTFKPIALEIFLLSMISSLIKFSGFQVPIMTVNEFFFSLLFFFYFYLTLCGYVSSKVGLMKLRCFFLGFSYLYWVEIWGTDLLRDIIYFFFLYRSLCISIPIISRTSLSSLAFYDIISLIFLFNYYLRAIYYRSAIFFYYKICWI